MEVKAAVQQVLSPVCAPQGGDRIGLRCFASRKWKWKCCGIGEILNMEDLEKRV